MPDIDPSTMTVEERLALIQRLWGSLDERDVALTAAQQEELQRRLDDMEANPHDDVSWEVVRTRITAQSTNPKPQP